MKIKKESVVQIKKKPNKPPKKFFGSDCSYCTLEEGVYCMMYFCKLKSSDKGRVVCLDGFSRTCEEYKKKKPRKKVK